jgi:hypothetical protein
LYTGWWVVGQKALGLLLGSMEPNIACQVIGCKSAAAAWTTVDSSYFGHFLQRVFYSFLFGFERFYGFN